MSNTATTLATRIQPDQTNGLPLRELVKKSLEFYFSQLDGEKPSNLYDLVLEETEAPLLKAVMTYTKSNQSKAAELLGISRNTLRKKLEQYSISQEGK